MGLKIFLISSVFPFDKGLTSWAKGIPGQVAYTAHNQLAVQVYLNFGIVIQKGFKLRNICLCPVGIGSMNNGSLRFRNMATFLGSLNCPLLDLYS